MKFLVLFCFLFSINAKSETITIGSKNFTEGYILGELSAQTLEDDAKFKVNRRFGIGGTGLVFEALQKGDIDTYIEYSGTIAEAILKQPKLRTIESIRNALAPMGLTISESLGFNDSYALAVRKEFAQKNKITKISDLKKLGQDARIAFSYEFMSRADGFGALTQHYQLDIEKNVQRMEHSLIYQAISENKVDVIEVYSTDANIEKMGLQVLEDDQNFFPLYNAVMITKKSFIEQHPLAWKKLTTLENSISEKTMQHLNAQADIYKKPFPQIIASYLNKNKPEAENMYLKIWQRTKEHLFLVLVALLFSTLVGVPLGLLAVRSKTLGQVILIVSSLLQTIPSLALLCFLIPLFGIGTVPALIALFLYGLLPVVVNTYEGVLNIRPQLLESAKSLGLKRWQRIRWIELPLASPSILAGIKTSAIISIGTATLAALIGAGGYGAPIVTGLALNDIPIILTGAIPATIMAILVHGVFEILRHFLIPRGLRL